MEEATGPHMGIDGRAGGGVLVGVRAGLTGRRPPPGIDAPGCALAFASAATTRQRLQRPVLKMIRVDAEDEAAWVEVGCGWLPTMSAPIGSEFLQAFMALLR